MSHFLAYNESLVKQFNFLLCRTVSQIYIEPTLKVNFPFSLPSSWFLRLGSSWHQMHSLAPINFQSTLLCQLTQSNTVQLPYASIHFILFTVCVLIVPFVALLPFCDTKCRVSRGIVRSFDFQGIVRHFWNITNVSFSNF